MGKFKSLLNEKNLIYNLPKPYWNFYEWSEGSNGHDLDQKQNKEYDEPRCDLILNCVFVYVTERYRKLCALCGESFDVDLDAIKKSIVHHFYNEDKGMYFLSNRLTNVYSQLGNAFAKLIGLTGKNVERAVRGECGVVPGTLSMKAFIYDALIEDREFILESIRKDYEHMLDCGATSFWETIKGEADFDGAGSLCHGWAAIPIYYFHKFLSGL